MIRTFPSALKVLFKCICGSSFIGAAGLIWILVDNWNGAFSIIATSAWCFVFLLATAQLVGALSAFQESDKGIVVLLVSSRFQIFGIGLENFAYLITAGPYLGVKYDAVMSQIGFEATIFQIAYKIDFSADYDFLSINLVTIFTIYILLKQLRLSSAHSESTI